MFQFRCVTLDDLEGCKSLLKDEDCFKASPEVWDAMIPAWEGAISTGLADTWIVFEDLDEPKADQLQGFGFSIMVRDVFVERLRSGAKAFAAGMLYGPTGFSRDFILSAREIARDNALGRLNLLVLHNALKHREPSDPRLAKSIPVGLASFQFSHAGYNLQNILWEVHGLHFLSALVPAGYSLIDDFSAQASVQKTAESKRPFLLAQERGLQSPIGYSLESSLLNTRKTPALGLSPGQKRLLQYALLDMDDHQIQVTLGKSGDSVKQTWRGIFEKFFRWKDSVGQPRPSAPRREILRYLRQHMEEIRPFEISLARETQNSLSRHQA
jgi:hypothetical protein